MKSNSIPNDFVCPVWLQELNDIPNTTHTYNDSMLPITAGELLDDPYSGALVRGDKRIVKMRNNILLYHGTENIISICRPNKKQKHIINNWYYGKLSTSSMIELIQRHYDIPLKQFIDMLNCME